MSTISSGTTSNTAYIVSADTTGDLVLSPTNFLSATQKNLGTSRVPAEQFYALNTALVGANSTAAQSVLGVGVTLVGSTVYQFEAVYGLARTAGATSHVISLLFGGTATLNNILYNYVLGEVTGAFPTQAANINTTIVQTAASTIVTATTSVASKSYNIFIKGTISVNAGGTFIPQYSLSSAPGGAYSTVIGSYFKISPLAASGSNVNIGTWA